MKKKITTTLFLMALLFAGQNSFAQYTLKQVIVLNEGAFASNMVTVGSYDLATKTYQNFDTLHAGFATSVIIDNGYIYVAADTLLVKYNLDTKQRLNVQTVKGIRKLAVWKNQLLVTRGETYKLPSFFQAYDKNTLGFIYESTADTNAAEGIKVLNDTAYIAINGFGTVGKLAIIDLNNQILNRAIDLGTNGLNPENVEVENATGHVYAINNLDWTNSSVTKYDVTTSTFTSSLLNVSSGCSGSVYYSNNIYFQTSGDNKLGVFNTLNLTLSNSLLINKQIYGMGIDSVNARIYVGVTDYTTYGKTFIYDFNGTLKDSFDVNISPGNFAFDVRTVAGVQENVSLSTLSVYPNPAGEQVHIVYTDAINKFVKLTLTDITGREIYKKNIVANVSESISIADLSQGIYLLKAETEKGVMIEKIVKK